ncbi:MAG: biotin--[acetyl-CoA-carboxylase] ligase, partial [Microthrixaceae bacterium]
HASATLGCEVVAHISGSEVRGRAVDLDSDGALLVDTGGPDPRRVVVGDVVNLRRA